MTRSLTLATLGLLVAVLPAATFAQTGAAEAEAGARGDHGARMLRHLDTDGSGTLSREEVVSPEAGRFARADADGDGRLTREELLAAAQARAAARLEAQVDRMLAHLDADDSGDLSEQELSREGRRAAMFDAADTDGDGELSREEMRAARKELRAAHREHRSDRWARWAHRMHGEHAEHGGHGPRHAPEGGAADGQ